MLEWNDRLSPEIRSAESLSRHLFRALQARLNREHLDCVDLIISGVEASLWVAEQLAEDIRMCLPEVVVLRYSVMTVCMYAFLFFRSWWCLQPVPTRSSLKEGMEETERGCRTCPTSSLLSHVCCSFRNRVRPFHPCMRRELCWISWEPKCGYS